MVDTAAQVKRIQEEAAAKKAEELRLKRLKQEIPKEVPQVKKNCNFCSHFRKKIVKGIDVIKKGLLGE